MGKKDLYVSDDASMKGGAGVHRIGGGQKGWTIRPAGNLERVLLLHAEGRKAP